MCGIVGIWGSKDAAVVAEMSEDLSHRGPDGQGEYVGSAGVLGHCRLSIIDPAGGDQPIWNEDRSKAIVANGEVYNHQRLRDDIQDRHQFGSGSDSETILHLYEDQACETAKQLDGMFAFAIADGNSLFAARDPIGIKPLYFGQKEDSLIFASELKALIGRADNVQAFPPGSWFHSDHGFRQFYTIPEQQPQDRPVADQLKVVRQTLEDAVLKRLMSDVPLGAFLSGGLDSSVIAAIARPHLKELHTFSVGIEGSRDLEAARVVSRYLDTIHHEYVFTVDEVLEKLPEIVYYLESFDQDLVRSAVPCYFTSRLAADWVKVILTGEGADELFAGYRYYKDLDGPKSLHDELRRSVSTLHNINLQRVDRLTMAHSIEGRVPFLDVQMIQMAQTVSPHLKLRSDGTSRPVEKWVLRQACADLLPPEIIWRDKEQFDEGSGSADLLSEAVRRWMTSEQAEKYRKEHPDARLRSGEECVYHRLLTDAFADPAIILDNVGRWSERG